MKKIDWYIGRNFMVGYLMAFLVLIGLRIIIDLFVNLDEFAEHSNLGVMAVFGNVVKFYGAQIFLYFRDFAGMIAVVAASFSLGRLIKNNELTAVMASGISLKRVIAPIILIAVVLNVLFVIDQEILIPQSAEKLVRQHDSVDGKTSMDIWFLSDSSGSFLCSPEFVTETETILNPIIFVREKVNDLYYKTVSQIRAEKAVWAGDGKWELVNGVEMIKPVNPLTEQSIERPVEYYRTDITPTDIPIRRKENFMDLLSSAQLSELIAQGPKIKDLGELYAQKHLRITTPLMNIIVLLVALPILVCRDPKTLKTAVMMSFMVTTICFIVIFASKMAAGEASFLRPEFWSWLPVLIFLPVALLELDSMKT